MTKEEILQTVSLRQVLAEYGVRVNRSGFCQCVKHNEKTASMKIYDKTNTFYCFGCHESGDVFDVVMALDKVDFNEAFKRLGGTYGRKPTNYALSKYTRQRRTQRTKEKREKLRKDFIRAAVKLRLARAAVNRTRPLSDAWCRAVKWYEYCDYLTDEAEQKLKEQMYE